MKQVDLSVVMPCLNEEKTVATCIKKALCCINEHKIKGEVIIADNGSTDNSIAVSEEAGARVVKIDRKGYGAAICGGIKEASGDYVIMGDADDSYDFEHLDAFLDKLRQGFDLVIGNRFQGGIAPGAMPFLHKYIGNPVLSYIGRLLYGATIGDFHCGLRAFDRKKIADLKLSCPGMEFASEMIVKASLAGLKIGEIPTTLMPDGRDRPPHLRSWRDGWRHLRFLLLLSPKWLFLYPGFLLFLFGAIGLALLGSDGLTFGRVGLGIHTMLYCSAFIQIGLLMSFLGIASRKLGGDLGYFKTGIFENVFNKLFSLEIGILLGSIFAIMGMISATAFAGEWLVGGMQQLDPSLWMPRVIWSLTSFVGGFVTIAGSFFIALLSSYVATYSNDKKF